MGLWERRALLIAKAIFAFVAQKNYERIVKPSMPQCEGKANQYFVRGFNLDHGTDLRISVDGMLVNQRSNGHGQGWSDLNFLIPELASGLQYQKGSYYADQGDFSSAGASAAGDSASLPVVTLNVEIVEPVPAPIATQFEDDHNEPEVRHLVASGCTHHNHARLAAADILACIISGLASGES